MVDGPTTDNHSNDSSLPLRLTSVKIMKVSWPLTAISCAMHGHTRVQQANQVKTESKLTTENSNSCHMIPFVKSTNCSKSLNYCFLQNICCHHPPTDVQPQDSKLDIPDVPNIVDSGQEDPDYDVAAVEWLPLGVRTRVAPGIRSGHLFCKSTTYTQWEALSWSDTIAEL